MSAPKRQHSEENLAKICDIPDGVGIINPSLNLQGQLFWHPWTGKIGTCMSKSTILRGNFSISFSKMSCSSGSII